MSNVSECIDLYLDDEVVSDEMFRAIIRDAQARDAVERATTLTYWRNLQEARRERMESEGA